MIDGPTGQRRKVGRLIPVVLLLAGLLTPVSSQADEVCGADDKNCYVVQQVKTECASEEGTTAGDTTYGGGQSEFAPAGNIYVACHDAIVVFSAPGKILRRIDLPWPIWDVAPSPNAEFLYVSTRASNVSSAAPAEGGTAARLVRGRDGSYSYDASWKLGPFVYGGKNYEPRGRYLATDARGDIYWSNGLWTDPQGPTVVARYGPDGSVKTYFGEWGRTWDPDLWYPNNGVAASADGQSVFVADQLHGRILRFDRRADGSYGPGRAFGNVEADDDSAADYAQTEPGVVEPGVVAICELGKFAAAADVALDAAGNVYGLSATCQTVQKFSPQGTPLASVDVNDNDASTIAPHGVAVSQDGKAIVVAQTKRKAISGISPENPNTHLRAVTLRFDRRADRLKAYGRVTVPDATAVCKRSVNVLVHVWVQSTREWIKVGDLRDTTTGGADPTVQKTDRRGRWSLVMYASPGRYRAVVPFQSKKGHKCLEDRSPEKTFG